MVTRANDIWAAHTTPIHPTLKPPLTKLLGPTATTPTAATTATPTAASTTATKAPTPATTPTAATTSNASTTSTAAPTTSLAATSTTPATLALAAAAPPTSGSSSNILSTKDVKSSSRGVGGGKGGGGTPLKEGPARSAMSGTYNNFTSLSCKEVLLEQGWVLVKEICWEGSAVASVASAKVGNEVLHCGKGGQLGKQVGQQKTAWSGSGRRGVTGDYSAVQRLCSPMLFEVNTFG
ncbi:unnamed protein product [Closterium sp. NIES-53]